MPKTKTMLPHFLLNTKHVSIVKFYSLIYFPIPFTKYASQIRGLTGVYRFKHHSIIIAHMQSIYQITLNKDSFVIMVICRHDTVKSWQNVSAWCKNPLKMIHGLIDQIINKISAKWVTHLHFTVEWEFLVKCI